MRRRRPWTSRPRSRLRRGRGRLSAAGLLAAAIACLPHAVARADVAVPALERRVTDLTGTLSPDARARIEGTLAEFESRKGAQVAVLLVPTTVPETIEQYAIRVADAWRLGRAGVDDGALLLVATQDRRLRIEVGYGLEGVLPDAIANRIIDQVIVPRFRSGDPAGGIEAGVAVMLRTIEGQALPPPVERRPGSGIDAGKVEMILLFGLVLAPVIGAMLRPIVGRLPAALVTGGAIGFVTWIVIASVVVACIAGAIGFAFTLASGAPGSRRRSRWGAGPHFGGGGWGGGHGGGWSGGGGGFGGGGASGRW